MGRVTTRVPRQRIDVVAGTDIARPDTIVVEEPLEVRLDGTALTTTMRTPGDDFDFAIGHLLTEGLIRSAEDIAAMMHCTDVDESGAPTFNVIDLTLAPGTTLAAAPRARTEAMTSACGVCGSQTIADVRSRLPYAAAPEDVVVPADVVAGLPDALREHQVAFDRTGGAHAAGVATPQGRFLAVREDIGRHNAVDKVVGALARERDLPLAALVLVVSARASFEIVQKAAMVGLPVVVAVGAPSSLAVDLAKDTGITLVAFARHPSFSVYANPARIGPATGRV